MFVTKIQIAIKLHYVNIRDDVQQHLQDALFTYILHILQGIKLLQNVRFELLHKRVVLLHHLRRKKY